MRLTIKGALPIHNSRASEVPRLIRCRFSGELAKGDFTDKVESQFNRIIQEFAPAME